MKTLAMRVTAAAKLALPVAIGASLLSAIAYEIGYPMLSPPIGASIYVCLRHPDAVPAQPRRMIASHVLAVLSGRIAREIVSAQAMPLAEATKNSTVLLAGVIALALTTFLVELTDNPHPPAAATTIVVALGVLPTTAGQIALLGAAVVLGAYSILLKKLRQAQAESRSASGVDHGPR